MNNARLYAGTALLIVAAVIRAAWLGDWSVAVVAVMGVLLILCSFAPEEGGAR